MSSSRSSKRARTLAFQSSYHDSVPLLDDYDTIHASESALRNIGRSTRTSRVHRDTQNTAGFWERVTSWSPPDDEQYALDNDGVSYDQALEADVMEESHPPPPEVSKKKKSILAKRPHVIWAKLHRQSYLDEILRWAGRGDFKDSQNCPDCISRARPTPGSPLYRCRECSVPDLVCRECCVKRHRMHPFHRIQHWAGTFFVEVSLKTLGLTIQLNHSSNYCESPLPCHADFLVLHHNGIHSVSLRYCGCSRQIPLHLQLLRRRLYPASQVSPQTCATFELLRHLHKMALTTKASTYDFYRCLEKSTNNTGISPPKSRYRALMRMVLQWRHLQMLKWAGRAHDPAGVDATAPGELGLVCPSCPHPGVNLPQNWADAPKELQFLYAMIICMDANFRLKNQLVSNYSQDPGLGIGWAYMVPRKPYESYVLSQVNDTDISTCVGFQALAKANTKLSTGLRYTGVNATVCGRSEMIFPVGVGNLHKGERYSNMDYIFASVLHRILVTMVYISYDIACQWFINLYKRMDAWPSEIRPPPGVSLTPAIPKLHEPMHKTKNHQVFSFNFIPGVGKTDGECPERVWGPHNALSNATKTQGPGSRQNVIDDHFGFWNWLKIVAMGTTLWRRYRAAVAERNTQAEAHRGLSSSLEPTLVSEWEAMCVEWETAVFPKQKPNPYYTEDATFTEAQVKKELGDEEAKHLEAGGNFPHKTTASMFIGMGLEIEEAQRRLQRVAKAWSTSYTLRREGTLAEQRNALLIRIRAWEQLLPIYIPGLLQYHADHPPSNNSDNAEEHPLWLPSRIPEDVRAKLCARRLPDIERRMRHAQLADSLNSVRQILKIKTRMIEFKNKNLRGQRDGTRSTDIIDRVHERARLAAAKYRAARVAHLALTGPGEWEATFRKLDDGDIRGYQDPDRLRPRAGRRGVLDDDQVAAAAAGQNVMEEEPELILFNEVRTKRDGTGETRRTLSWIWVSGSSNESDKDDILRVEWAKSRARMNRSKEEVMLLKEEMRRVLEFLAWKARWWRERGQMRTEITKDLLEGLQAYSLAQADLFDRLAVSFKDLWKAPLDSQHVSSSESKEGNDGDEEDDDDDNDNDEEFTNEHGAAGDPDS